jgi:hypothetical protein
VETSVRSALGYKRQIEVFVQTCVACLTAQTNSRRNRKPAVLLDQERRPEPRGRPPTTKNAKMLTMLRSSSGATIVAMMKETGLESEQSCCFSNWRNLPFRILLPRRRIPGVRRVSTEPVLARGFRRDQRPNAAPESWGHFSTRRRSRLQMEATGLVFDIRLMLSLTRIFQQLMSDLSSKIFVGTEPANPCGTINEHSVMRKHSLAGY